MSVQIDEHLYHSTYATSGDGITKRVREVVLHIGGALTPQGTTSTGIEPRLTEEQTNSGLVVIGGTTTPSSPIGELRRRTGLTWDQIARLFGVERRSVHFWASGKALNASNEERLSRLLSVVLYVDRGSAHATRAALLTPLSDGTIPVDLLAKEKFDQVKRQLGGGPQRPTPVLRELSPAARAARMPPSPEERVGALHDKVHRGEGKIRKARTLRARSKR